MRRIGILVVLAGCIVAGLIWFWLPRPNHQPPVGSKQVRIAAAANLQYALDEVLLAFNLTHPDIQVKVTYGASDTLQAQLSNRAPFDLFLSADLNSPRQLIDQGHADRDSLFVYAIGHLVVWVPQSSSVPVETAGIKALLDPKVKKIALANPQQAPYGRAAQEALRSLGVFEQVKERLVPSENVAQAAQAVQNGKADVALLARSLALAPALKQEGRSWDIPVTAYPRLEQAGVILSWAQDRQAANACRAFLLNREGREILRGYGYSLPGE